MKDYIEKDGVVEVWEVYISSHPWKNRSSKRTLVDTISKDEYAQILADKEVKLSAYQKAADEKKAAETSRKAWVATLPDNVAGLTIDKGQMAVCDSYGNYLFPLPAGPVSNIEEWVEAEMDAYMGGYE